MAGELHSPASASSSGREKGQGHEMREAEGVGRIRPVASRATPI